jgi:hypothetical protein
MVSQKLTNYCIATIALVTAALLHFLLCRGDRPGRRLRYRGSARLHYQLTGRAALIGKWHSEHGFGGGLSLAF